MKQFCFVQTRNGLASLVVSQEMIESAMDGSTSTRVWIMIGAALFVVALIGSAAVIPELRLLHFLQALIYVAVVILARRNSMWGLGAGFTIGVAWNAISLFVSRLMQAGAVAFWQLLRTGQVERPDTMMVLLGSIGHFILIAACLIAFFNEKTDNRKWWKFAGGGVLCIAYFALIIAVAAPR